MKPLATVLCSFAIVALAQAAEPTTPLFNGKDLTGWKATGKADAWAVEDGMIVCKKGGGGYLLTDKEYGDFDFRCQFRWAKEGGNSGVGIRTPEKGDPAYAGMEIQLIDDENWEKVRKGKLADYQHTGSIYDVQPAKARANKPIGEWNTIRVVCQGRKVNVWINGEETVNANLDDYSAKFTRHPGLKREKGHIGFQSYNDRVEFKDVVIQELK